MGLLTQKERHNQTFGILNMGEISTQIAFSVKSNFEYDSQKNNSGYNEIEKIKLFETDHEVYSNLNLCFGIDQIINRYFVGLILESGHNTSNIENPCSHKDQPNFSMRKEDLLNSYCTSNDFINKMITLPFYNFHAVPDIEKCKKMSKKLINVNYVKEVYQDFSFKPISQNISSEAKFYALTNYFKSVSQLKNSEKIKFKNEEELTTEIENYCKKPWDEITKNHKEQDKYLRTYCFSLNYVLLTLKKVYKFNGDQFANIEFRSKLNGNELDWSLGYMIQATNSIPGKLVEPNLKTTGFIIIIFISLSLLFGSLYTFYNKTFFKESES